MHLAAGDHVIPVNQSVDQALEHRAFRIVGHFCAPGICLFPALFCVVAHKFLAALQQSNQTAAELLVVQRFHHAGRLVQPIPAGAEQPGEPHGRFVGQQRTRMGQEALFIHQTERNKILCVQFKSSALAVNRAELGKGKALKPIQRGETVIGAVASAKNKPFQVGGCGLYALIAHTDIGNAPAISNIVVRRFSPCGDVKQNEVLSFLLPDLQLNRRNGVHLAFDSLADLLAGCFHIRKPFQSVIIRNAEQENATVAIGKGADALQPAFGSALFQRFLFIVFRCFANIGSDLHYIHLIALFSSAIMKSSFPLYYKRESHEYQAP